MNSQEFCVFGLLLAAACASPLGAQSEGNNGFSTTEQTISPFIKRKDICVATEQQYETPAVMMVGTKDKLLRCVYNDPETCETFYTTGSKVYSLLVVGDFVYAGLNNTILICYLKQNGSCTTYEYQTYDTFVQSLATAKGYLYAGLELGGILRCRLNEPNSCQIHVKYNSPWDAVYALIQVDEYLYAGLWSGNMMRCSLVTKDNCTLMYTMTQGITGFSYVGKSILGITFHDSKIWNCSRKANGVIDSCVSLSLVYHHPIDMAFFHDVWYTVEEEKCIHTCEWGNNSVVCTPYGNIDKPASIAFAYATLHMRGRYTNENISCVWRSPQCPPLVIYYDAERRTQFEIHVKDGRLYNAMGALVDTTDADDGHAIFAMGPDGRILLSNLHKAGVLHTSSFFAGGPVAGAGELVVKSGVIEKMTTCSEHYRPPLELNRQVVESLRVQGYADPVHAQECEGGELGQPSGNVQ